MARKRLLIVSYHFPPSAAIGAQRVLGLARHLPDFGWDVVVVAPPRTPHEKQDPELLQEVPRQTVVLSVPYPGLGESKLARYFAPHGIWLPWAMAACGRAIPEYSPAAILTTSPPHVVQLGGYWLKRRYGLPWVADFRDPWIAGTLRAQQANFMTRCERYWEKRALAAADRIIANAPNAGRALRGAFPLYADKIVTVTNGFDPDKSARPAFANQSPQTITLLHAGELYAKRDPRPLLEAVAALSRSGDMSQTLRLNFLGQANLAECDLAEEIRRHALVDQVHVESQASYRSSLERMMQTDILVLIDAPGRKAGVPGKLYEYLGAGRPILALADAGNDTDWVLRQSGVLHRLADPANPTVIRHALEELIKAIQLQQPAVPCPEKLAQFTRRHMARSIAELLDECVGSQSRLRAWNVPGWDANGKMVEPDAPATTGQIAAMGALASASGSRS